MLAWLSPGKVNHWFNESLLKLYDSPMWDGTRINLVSGPRIAEARSQIFDRFLQMDPAPEWILLVDTDMTFTPDDVGDLWLTANRTSRQVVGGLCFAGGHTTCVPTLYETVTLEDGTPGPSLVDHHKAKEMMDLAAPVKVAATGAAFLLVNRVVVERMKARHPHGFGTYEDGRRNPYPWFVEGQHVNGHAIGEDVAFTWRAHVMGFGVHVHTGVEIDHWKERPLNRELWDSLPKIDAPTLAKEQAA